ncbi:hypothetical protein EDC04DRAFT_974763 [Pisolithus marmoratus]|nr:hypothetical protein EDC04DRAFT_974763 [Pisolithus marmoratus]
MNTERPPRPRSRGSTASDGAQSTYEDDLLRILTRLGPEGTNQLREYYERRNCQGRQMTDHEVAMSMLLQNARVLEGIEEDRVFALALDRALYLEDEAVMPMVEGTIRDQPNPPRPRNTPTTAVNLIRRGDNIAWGTQPWGEWVASIFNELFVAPQTSTTRAATPVAPTQQDPPPATTPARPTGHVCVICDHPVHGSEIRAPCGHYYDIPCIINLFQSAARDETLYPPHCCNQNIPFPQVQPHLSHELVTEFQEKSKEYETLNRVYCVQKTCSRFLGPLTNTASEVAVYTCPALECGTSTCGSCRGRYDGCAHTCRQDQDAEDVLKYGRTKGWVRCSGCSQLIELNMGCYHMTCRCKTEFCYSCSARWKTCKCPQWDEGRLFTAAEQGFDAQLGDGDHHHRLRNVYLAGHIDPVQPIQPRPQNPPVVQPRVQPAHVVQPRAPPAIPAVRPAVPPRTPDTLQYEGLPILPLFPTPPVQPRALTADFPAVDTTARRNQTRDPYFSTVQSSAMSTQHRSHARSHVQAVQAAQSPQASTSTNLYSRAHPAVPLTPTSLTLTMTSPQPGLVVPPILASLTPAGLSRSLSSIREQAGGHRTTRSRYYQDANQWAAGTSARTMDTGLTSASNVGTQNDIICQRIIHEMAERVPVDHDCQHNWEYRHGAERCENCHRVSLYLFRCLRCEMLVCNQCRLNRL